MEREKVIEVKELVKRFGTFTANDRLTFDVYRGEIFGFLGANGAGKTTAMRILCGLSRPTSGRVMVAGIDASRRPEEIKKRIGYMSQRFSLYEDLTVRENIELYGGIYGMTLKQIVPRREALLERLSFQQYGDMLIRALPLGLRQKLAFAVAVFGSEPSAMMLIVVLPSRAWVDAIRSGKIITALIFPFLNVASISLYEASCL